MKPITPCLWFENNGEEAAKFYVSVFKNSKLGAISYYSENMPMPAGTVLTVEFQINGQDFIALNGGPVFKFNEAISFTIYCDTQEEIDDYWKKLSAVPEAEVCGWLKDKYGVSWQITPSIIPKLVADKEKSPRVMAAVMKMKKLDIETIKRAAEGK